MYIFDYDSLLLGIDLKRFKNITLYKKYDSKNQGIENCLVLEI